MKLTIFAMPKPFEGHIDVIQRNAIRSWMKLRIQPEIILFGEDESIVEVSREFGLQYMAKVARNERAAPLLNDLFAQAERNARTDLLCYVNADMLLLDDFADAVERVSSQRPPFMMIGQRTNMDVTEPIDFRQTEWEQTLRKSARTGGELRPPNAIDFFVFTKGLGSNLLPLAIGNGCPWWDNWLLWHARSQEAAVIDASRMILAIHQNHPSANPQGAKATFESLDAKLNRAMVGEWYHLHTTEDATHRLTPKGLERRYLHPWLVVKRAWSHPRGMVLLILKLLTQPFRRSVSPAG